MRSASAIVMPRRSGNRITSGMAKSAARISAVAFDGTPKQKVAEVDLGRDLGQAMAPTERRPFTDPSPMPSHS